NGTIGDFTNPLPLSITKTGAATWSLGNSSNTYSGATIINAGILQATKLAVGGSPSSIGESTNAATNLILNGGTLQYAGTGDTTDRNFTLLPGGGALDASGSGAVTFSNTAILSPDPANQAVTTTANATITGITTTVGLYVGMPVGDGDNLIPNGTTISSIASATSIVLSHAAAAGSTTLDFGYGARTLTLTGTSTSSNSIAGILQDSQTVNTTVGTLSITKTGAGTWELGGANTYTGPTAVNGGTLLVDGSIASPTTVGNTGTLGGHGTISNSVTISAGGTLSPGDSPGQLTVNSLALTSSGTGSTTLMQIGGTTLGSQYDNVDVTTSAGLAYGGALQIVSYSPWNVSAQSDIYDLFTFTGGATGDFSGVTVDGFSLTDSSGIWSGTNGGATYTFADSTGILDVSGAVPEPASLCLLGLGGGMMLLRRRRAAKMI
ncbi:MAG TPA: autotransporter-associated beta strand repeat-containing protein, partial [Tepidisphaeraceae bacterium]|nr:autotransporter-associated beta strand repeat-containing protein [Tepidisphaeraceae bacterium]